MAYQEMYFVQLFGLTAKNRLSLVATYHANNAEHAVARAQAYFDRGAAYIRLDNVGRHHLPSRYD